GAHGRLQPRRGQVRRDQRRPQLLSRNGHCRLVRRAGRRHGHPRLAVPDHGERRAGIDDCVPRHRRRAARPEHGDRRRALRAPVRGAPHRHRAAQPDPRRLPAGAGDQPDAPDPGARRPLRRCRPPGDLDLARETQAGPGAAEGEAHTMPVRAEAERTWSWERLTSPRSIGILGILLGVLAFWLALPPLAARSPFVPATVGILAIAAGVFAATRGAGRVGWGAAASGVLGIVLGLAATTSGESNLDLVVVWPALLGATLRYATPLTFAAIGGMFSERSGVVNIGLEGMMLMGAYFGAYGADVTGSWGGGLFIGLISGALLAFVHAIFTITLRADQIVTGTAINFLA